MARLRLIALLVVAALGAACGASPGPRLLIEPAPSSTAASAFRNSAAPPASTGAARNPTPPVARTTAVTKAEIHEDTALRAAVVRALGADADTAAVVVRRLTDGRWAAVNPDRVLYAASLYKLAVLYEAFRQRDAGLLSFDTVLPVSAKYIDEDLGTFARVPRAGNGGVTAGDAVAAMVTLSDNTSATLLLDVLGHRVIDRTMVSLGLRDSSVNTVELPVSARDMARLMEAIVRGEGLRPAAAHEMTALLLAQETRDGIPRGIPAGVAVGNKTGTWPGATHDVAVVFAPSGAFVLTVLTQASWGWEPIARVAAAVYEELERLPAGARRQP